jgi:hypothetical protein
MLEPSKNNKQEAKIATHILFGFSEVESNIHCFLRGQKFCPRLYAEGSRVKAERMNE